MDFVDFDDKNENKFAKTPRLNEKYCKAYGQFLNFIIKQYKKYNNI